MGRVQRIHFVGIGGAGMSGLAEVLHNLGYSVSGSDAAVTAVTRHLVALGITVAAGHDPSLVDGADVVVVSGAIPAANPELAAARVRRTPIVPRAEMLAEIMRFRQGIAIAGTHGKTTTTSLTACLLAEGGLDPTFVIGGRLNSAGSHARLGEGRYIVAEADESDASFLRLNPVLAVVTNIDADHLGTYGGDPERLRHAFVDFLQRLPFYGLAVLCVDDAGVRRTLPELSRPVLTYGIDARADLAARNLRPQGPVTRFEISTADGGWREVALNLPGRHNVLNALAAIAVARELGVNDDDIARGLENFAGVGRRFQLLGEVRIGAATALLVDDYGHHPTEIAATVAAVRAGWPGRRIVLAYQLHRYSRTRDLFEDFVGVLSTVDVLLLLDVYPAGEDYIPGADGRSLTRAIRVRGRIEPIFVATTADLPGLLRAVVADGDVVLMVGAGSIGQIAPALVQAAADDARAAGAAAETRR
ncbi:MAG: UDP-N-acetylmuramate--L-alanine ligase [Gammaproteobacteria bacterium]|nr:UDP-N-acetylmuramate--L-alanine ligase [Gammaproteobacteria bacterium]